ncbi:hypothetical protein MAR_007734 [Mya arenaria]|uniref:Protein CUSTOS n=1 Tax=Mya arenaria TaxID=6604 RepID=A0ABY7DWV9_MYAAR|nr:hypothetical protein MAR_007734 [Mya arenaria]
MSRSLIELHQPFHNLRRFETDTELSSGAYLGALLSSEESELSAPSSLSSFWEFAESECPVPGSGSWRQSGARMLDDLMEGASPGAAGTVSLTGWSNTDVFEYYMKHHLLKNVVPDHQIAPSTTFTDSEAEVNTPMVSNTKACETPSAEQFFEQRGGKILQNVQKAKKSRNTLSKIIGGMAITEDDILAQIKAHTDKYGPSKIKEKKSASKENNKKRKQTSPKASTSNSVKKPKKVLESSENCDSSDEEDVPDSEKCVMMIFYKN